MNPDLPVNRRQFLQTSTLAAAAWTAWPAASSASPAERVRVAFMGLGGRGSGLLRFFADRPDVEVAWLCDADRRKLPGAVKLVEATGARAPRQAQDFRRMLEDPQVDAVVNATPDHWHALGTILACQAGKDVYVEKPLSHNLREGRKMIEAARKYQRVVQLGTQSRSAPYLREAREAIRGGKLGEVLAVRVFNLMEHGKHPPLNLGPVPAELDYDLWSGPAPLLPYASNRSWLDEWEYSCGAVPGDAIHQLDLARALLGDPAAPDTVCHTGGVQALLDGRAIPDTQWVAYEYGKVTLLLEAALWTPYMKKTPMHLRDTDEYPNWVTNGTRIEVLGTRGFMYYGRHGDGWQVFDSDWKAIGGSPGKQSDREHIDNFIACVRSRQRPKSDVEEGHRSTLLCHLANISFRCGNRKLAFDRATESFPASPDANRFLGRDYRAPWVVPDVV